MSIPLCVTHAMKGAHSNPRDKSLSYRGEGGATKRSLGGTDDDSTGPLAENKTGKKLP